MDGLEAGIAAHAVRLCAICDGYEASDADIAVLAPVDVGIHHAAFLRSFSRTVAVVPSEAGEPSPDCARSRRAEAGIELLPPALSMRCEAMHGCVVETAAGTRRFDTLYPVLGQRCAVAAGRPSWARRWTTTPNWSWTRACRPASTGLYAIGDVVSALNQISVAMGHAAIAASALAPAVAAQLARTAG
jgi:thioredoxin reductase (NADPH)